MLMEVDVEGLIGARRYERSGERSTWRNGYRERTLDTRLGSLQLRIPKLRQGTYFPPFLEARKSSEKALVAVIQEARIGGVSTRRVDDLVQAMGLSGIGKSQVSCKEIDERVHAFLDRPLATEWPYLWLDATHLKDCCRFGQGAFARTHGNGRVAPKAVVSALLDWSPRGEAKRKIVVN
jgi:transposase-like protein